MPVDPTRRYRDAGMDVDVRKPLPPEDQLLKQFQENQEQRMHEIYRYAFFTDKAEGLIGVNVDTLADRVPKNNFFRRAVTFNPMAAYRGGQSDHWRYVCLRTLFPWPGGGGPQ